MTNIRIRTLLNLMLAAGLAVFLTACDSRHEAPPIPVVEDSVLTTNVKTALAADPELQSLNLSVAAKAGVVQLSGDVDSYPKIDRALTIVRGVSGVREVDDKTVMKK